MQSALSRIWTHVTMSISYDDNHYTTGNCYSKNLNWIQQVHFTCDKLLDYLHDMINKYKYSRVGFEPPTRSITMFLSVIKQSKLFNILCSEIQTAHILNATHWYTIYKSSVLHWNNQSVLTEGLPSEKKSPLQKDRIISFWVMCNR